MDLKAFGERLRKARRAKGLNQEAVATGVGAESKGTVSGWENGSFLPESLKLVRLIQLLDVSADWLLFDRGDMKAATEKDARTLLGKVRALLEITPPSSGKRGVSKKAAAERAAREAARRKAGEEPGG